MLIHSLNFLIRVDISIYILRQPKFKLILNVHGSLIWDRSNYVC
jgi:hypothetical protein